jgi:hypothetical protein
MTSQSERPAVLLRFDRAVSASLVQAFELGCEEEGVPSKSRVGTGDATTLARQAARDSALFIGAGIDADGGIALHEQRLGERPPLLSAAAATVAVARRFGAATGRLARGRPLPEAAVP